MGTHRREPSPIIDGLSILPSVRLRHTTAPLLAEREHYLRQLSARGLCRVTMRVTAAYLLHVIRVMQLVELRSVTMEEIEEAGRVWASYVGPERRCKLEGTPEYFTRVAKQWFTFTGCLAPAPLPPFSEQLDQYAETLKKIQGRAPATIDSYKKSVAAFFRYVNPRHADLDTLQLSEIHQYLAKLRAAGQKNSSIASQCNALRSFFKHAELVGWCSSGIALGIKSPRIAQYQGPARGPAWRDVRRLVRQRREAGSKQLRTHAILLLLAIYGLRRSEVARLQLGDFDWLSETFIVRRAKNRGIQQFPIQYEVGEAIIRYLRLGRPHCQSRHLFVSLKAPHPQYGMAGLWRTVSEEMKNIGVKSISTGPHALRHACATRLLNQGSSLQEIADFLGHRNLNSVSIYARYDTRSLRQVASFGLQGVL